MTFDFETRYDKPTPEDLTIKDLAGEELKKTLGIWVDNLYDLIAAKQSKKLAKQGYTLILNGAWGSGKTTATRSLVKDLRAKCSEKYKLHFLEYSFLPYGNVNESIADFINQLAGRLWKLRWLDMRHEVKCLVTLATPSDEAKYTIGVNTGVFTAGVQRGWKSQTAENNEERLVARFSKLSAQKKVLILSIDDLDRLKPHEVVAVLRMIDKLRILPNVLIVLPIHKTIAANAVKEALKLPRLIDAQTFLRKATDAELSINNTLPMLKEIFLEGWGEVDSELNDIWKTDSIASKAQICQSRETPNLSLFCWYTLLHVAILEEAITDIEENMLAGEGEGNAFSKALEYSEYLMSLREALYDSRQRTGDAAVMPVSNHIPDGTNPGTSTARLVPAGGSHEYGPLAEPGSGGSSLQHLKLLARRVDYNDKWLYTGGKAAGAIGSDNKGQFDETARYILMEFFLPRVAAVTNEPFITQNLHGYFKLREMKKLSRSMRLKLHQYHDDHNEDYQYNVVKLIFETAKQCLEDLKR